MYKERFLGRRNILGAPRSSYMYMIIRSLSGLISHIALVVVENRMEQGRLPNISVLIPRVVAEGRSWSAFLHLLY